MSGGVDVEERPGAEDFAPADGDVDALIVGLRPEIHDALVDLAAEYSAASGERFTSADLIRQAVRLYLEARHGEGER